MLPPLLKIDKIAIFLDFDGTLVDFAPAPDAVAVPADVKLLLRELRVELEGALALVTGRSLASLDALVNDYELCAAGCHGGEWRTLAQAKRLSAAARGQAQRKAHTLSVMETGNVDSGKEALSLARSVLSKFLREHKVRLEDKPYSLALHFRHNPEIEPELDAWLDQHFAALAELRVIKGKCVREIQLTGVNKGMAVERFMQQPPFVGRIPVYLGDDVTDEDAFLWVNQVGGVSIKVGAGATRANYRLSDFQAVSRWLRQLLKEVH